jgi:hypothetical protein
LYLITIYSISYSTFLTTFKPDLHAPFNASISMYGSIDHGIMDIQSMLYYSMSIGPYIAIYMNYIAIEMNLSLSLSMAIAIEMNQVFFFLFLYISMSNAVLQHLEFEVKLIRFCLFIL